jgi:hypothetical protein
MSMRFIRVQNPLDLLPDLRQVHPQRLYVFEFALRLGFLDKRLEKTLLFE